MAANIRDALENLKNAFIDSFASLIQEKNRLIELRKAEGRKKNTASYDSKYVNELTSQITAYSQLDTFVRETAELVWGTTFHKAAFDAKIREIDSKSGIKNRIIKGESRTFTEHYFHELRKIVGKIPDGSKHLADPNVLKKIKQIEKKPKEHKRSRSDEGGGGGGGKDEEERKKKIAARNEEILANLLKEIADLADYYNNQQRNTLHNLRWHAENRNRLDSLAIIDAVGSAADNKYLSEWEKARDALPTVRKFWKFLSGEDGLIREINTKLDMEFNRKLKEETQALQKYNRDVSKGKFVDARLEEIDTAVIERRLKNQHEAEKLKLISAHAAERYDAMTKEVAAQHDILLKRIFAEKQKITIITPPPISPTPGPDVNKIREELQKQIDELKAKGAHDRETLLREFESRNERLLLQVTNKIETKFKSERESIYNEIVEKVTRENKTSFEHLSSELRELIEKQYKIAVVKLQTEMEERGNHIYDRVYNRLYKEYSERETKIHEELMEAIRDVREFAELASTAANDASRAADRALNNAADAERYARAAAASATRSEGSAAKSEKSNTKANEAKDAAETAAREAKEYLESLRTHALIDTKTLEEKIAAEARERERQDADIRSKLNQVPTEIDARVQKFINVNIESEVTRIIQSQKAKEPPPAVTPPPKAATDPFEGVGGSINSKNDFILWMKEQKEIHEKLITELKTEREARESLQVKHETLRKEYEAMILTLRTEINNGLAAERKAREEAIAKEQKDRADAIAAAVKVEHDARIASENNFTARLNAIDIAIGNLNPLLVLAGRAADINNVLLLNLPAAFPALGNRVAAVEGGLAKASVGDLEAIFQYVAKRIAVGGNPPSAPSSTATGIPPKPPSNW